MQLSAIKNTVTHEPFFLHFNSALCNPEDDMFVVRTYHNGNHNLNHGNAENVYGPYSVSSDMSSHVLTPSKQIY